MTKIMRMTRAENLNLDNKILKLFSVVNNLLVHNSVDFNPTPNT